MHFWYPILGYALVFLLLKPVLAHVLLFTRARKHRLSAPRFEPLTRETTPAAFVSVFQSVEPELEAIGFQFEQAVNCVPKEGDAYRTPVWCYLNPETRVRAVVRRLQLATGGVPRLWFETHFADECMVATSADVEPEGATDLQILNKIPELPVAEQYQRHLDFVQSRAAERSPVCISIDERAAKSVRQWEEAMRAQTARGQVFQTADGCFAYTIREATRRTFSALAKVKKLNTNQVIQAAARKISATADASSAIEGEVEYYHQISKRSSGPSFSGVTKTIMLVVSMVLFVLAFRLSFSWQTVLILLGVLTFHEGGHLLGMRLFGYQNLQMLYLPFLGAVAIAGKRHYVAPWKELVVLFLGPLPGFVIGLLILTTPLFEHLPLRHETGLMLLSLNLFNLLPIYPLDGGQIWDILLFRRMPFARVAFLGLSATALLLAGASHLFGSAFVIFGLSLLLQLRRQFRQARIMRTLAEQFGPSLSQCDEAALVPAIFGSIRQLAIKLNMPQKIAFVRAVVAECKTAPAGLVTALFGLAAYTSPAWLGIIALTVHHALENAASATALQQARAGGLLDLPVEAAPGPKDATPLVVQFQDLLQSKEVDRKFQAIERDVRGASPQWPALQRSWQDPDVAAALALARKIAESDGVRSDPGKTFSKREIADWLALSAECAAQNGDSAAAWADVEDAFRTVYLKADAGPAGQGYSAELSLSRAFEGMKQVLHTVSPSGEEMARLESLLAPAHLALPIVRDRLAFAVWMVDMADMSKYNPKGALGFALSLYLPRRSYIQAVQLAKIPELKQQWQAAIADSGATEEYFFGEAGTPLPELVAEIRLARAALALEKARAGKGQLPASLETTSLTKEQRETIAWDPHSCELSTKGPAAEIEFARYAGVSNRRGNASEGKDERADGRSRYTWTLRPDSPSLSRSAVSAHGDTVEKARLESGVLSASSK